LDATFTHHHWPLSRPVTLIIAESHFHTPTGVSPSLPAHSRALQLRKQHPICYNTPHLYYVTETDSVWAHPFSLAATSGISIDFSSSSYSDASLRTVRPPKRKQGSVYREISFGNLGIYGRMHLPQAYRSLPRPSSLIKPSHPPTGVFAPVCHSYT
jgi:hypothetical protein